VRPEARLDFASATPDCLADTVCKALAQRCTYRPVETGGASTAARLIAELL
jgi:hypothetical protein